MTHPDRRTPPHRPRPGRRRHRAASLGAALATLALGLAGQLTAHPAAGTGAGEAFAGHGTGVTPTHAPAVPAYSGTAAARGLPPV
ncbi:hypothetical protein [Streptomyces sp. NPDC001356]|uniref:Uncharacterized protein n=1 Tax=Streptomyces argyrophylli TaxID=2726118 RepID=A0A6M4PT30_9ACTN|nr:hypothetical protein HKX69_33335 [Streptomyces argyrophyllae]